jgi:molecular chaperone DnaK (HSP70)
MTPWEIVWFLVPMRLFRPLVNGHFLHRLPWDIEVNLTRLASQWTESLSISMDDIAQQAKVFIRQEIDTVENLLNKAPDQRREIEKAISELEGIKNSIK